MSVFMTLRVQADPKRLQEAIASDESRWQAINREAKERGCIHHRFMASADRTEIVVADEWESAEAFQTFFQTNQEIPRMMGELGITSEPVITFWHALDTPDAF